MITISVMDFEKILEKNKISKPAENSIRFTLKQYAALKKACRILLEFNKQANYRTENVSQEQAETIIESLADDYNKAISQIKQVIVEEEK